MRGLLQKLPFPVEFAVVVAGAFALPIAASTMALFHHSGGPLHSVPGMSHIVARDAVVVIVLGLFLRLRGWTLDRVGLQSHWSDGLHGVGLAVAGYFAYYLAWIALNTMAPGATHTGAASSGLPHALPVWLVIAYIPLNALFEEGFVVGYVIAALKEKGGAKNAVAASIAINVSVALRLSYHLYQGAAGVVGIIPIGLIFAYWYERTGKLWPVVVAHAAIEILAFLPYLKF